MASQATVADIQDRALVGELASAVQEAPAGHAECAYEDQGYRGPEPAAAAAAEGSHLAVIKLPQAKRGFVLLPKRRQVERCFG